MRTITSLVALFALLLPAHADEPPSYNAFESTSPNGRFVAEVRANPWTLTMNEVVAAKKGERKRMWSTPFRHPGYPGVTVANDGLAAAVVYYWYPGDTGIGVELYRPGAPIGTVRASTFAVPASALQHTVSHSIWMKPESVKFKGETLVFETLDKRSHTVHRKTGAVASLDGPPVVLKLGKTIKLPEWRWRSSSAGLDLEGPEGARLWVGPKEKGVREVLQNAMHSPVQSAKVGKKAAATAFADGISWCAVADRKRVYALGVPAESEKTCDQIFEDTRFAKIVKPLRRRLR